MVEVVRGFRVGTRIFTPHGTVSNGDKLNDLQRKSLRDQGYEIDRLASLPVWREPIDAVEQAEEARKLLGFAFVDTGAAAQNVAAECKHYLRELLSPLKKAFHLKG